MGSGLGDVFFALFVFCLFDFHFCVLVFSLLLFFKAEKKNIKLCEEGRHQGSGRSWGKEP